MFSKIRLALLFLFFLFLPTQLGTFFFIPESYVNGLRIDYLALALYATDCIAALLMLVYAPVLRIPLTQKRILAILIVLGISAMGALSPTIGFYKVLKVILWIGIAAICWYEAKRDTAALVKLLVPALAVGSVGELVLSVLQIQNQATIQGPFYWLGERALSITTPEVARSSLAGTLFLRPYGTFSHPNSLGGFYLLVYLFLYFWPLAKASPRARAVALFCSTLIIFISFSKAVVLTFVLINGFLFLQFFLAKKCKLCGVARIVSIGVLAFIFSSAQGDPLGIEKRITLIDHAVTIIQNYPLFGVGLGNYVLAEAAFPAQYTTFFLQPVHNIVLLVLAEIGIVGTGAMVAILFTPFLILSQNRVFRYCFAGVLLTGMVDHYWLTLQQNILLLGIISGCVFEASTKKKLEKSV